MKNEVKKKGSCLVSLFLAVIVILGGLSVLVSADNPTVVYVSPNSLTVSAGQTFTLDIACTPGQMIKSYELKLSFDPSLVHANQVTEGTIFNGYTTFFNEGTIDNVAGTIVDVYGLILGAGMVQTPGSLISISFTAQAASGTTSIDLYDVGVTNESVYVPITTMNGTVELREFTLTVSTDGSGSVTKNPDQATYPYGTVVQLTAIPDEGWMFSTWTGDASGSNNPISITMTSNKSVVAHFTQHDYILTIQVEGSGTVSLSPNLPSYAYGAVVTLTAEPTEGWAFTYWSGDLTGSDNPETITIDGNKTVVAHFVDSMAPEISGVTQTTSNPLDTDPLYGWVNVSCTVTDNIAVSEVMLCIHTPSGAWTNVSMLSTTPGVYYYRSATAFSQAGNYTYTIVASDSTGNDATSSQVLFSMLPNWDINGDGVCTIFDLVLVSNHYGETSSNGWIREDADNNGTVSVLDLVYLSNHYNEMWW
ncbi:MAG: hypothetical protein JXA00_04820 [Candidatus Thermoplasmatota archaeon]|nr:hypothetical protein [Candidatus Thermoplasmatota archaeon]